MTSRITLVFAAFLASGSIALAADGAVTDDAPISAVEAWQLDPQRVFDASEVDLADFQWIARPIVVFADTSADPRFREQIELLAERPDELIGRDVVVIVDTDPGGRSDLRRKLRPRGFMLALLGKDGGVKLRKPFPWDVRELTRSIDKMPLRQQEIRDEKAADG
ncbi:MAG: DUF4174 domain-containing protein [Rhodobacteraceae bacterium]|nr:DUF4174 domain-containing protein [Alphaproteobacteria bacterium]MBT8477183.1 DUF4174 domain-containing protein [Alphaproteobacteria bacterium]NNK67532.1 DUF4174 domain-containing protein [Paracoccaceae bacterium]